MTYNKTMDKQDIEFLAEINSINAKKTASLDITYKLELMTDDVSVLALGALDGDKMIKVNIEVVE